jgi:hypothetical protein
MGGLQFWLDGSQSGAGSEPLRIGGRIRLMVDRSSKLATNLVQYFTGAVSIALFATWKLPDLSPFAYFRWKLIYVRNLEHI